MLLLRLGVIEKASDFKRRHVAGILIRAEDGRATVQITCLPQGFGAQVSEFDLHQSRTPAEIVRLQQAYNDHHLLVFRGPGRIAPERQVEIAGWFGRIGANTGEGGRPWTVLHNDDAAGSCKLPFHCDISFMEFPLEGISLHPLELPGSDTSTTFVSNALAWDGLPEAMKAELRDRKARHFYADAQAMNFDWPVLEYWHPVCMPHPKTGRSLLFVTEHHVDRIEGMDEKRGAELLQVLFTQLYVQERRYEHVWCEGDLVIWDNLAVQHARTRASEPTDGPRALRRVALGEVGFLEQLGRSKQR